MKEYTFRDPVHGDISVQDPVILGLIDAPEFQRLRRIRQLGTSFISYPGAEHTRFAHSLGVYHLLQRVLRHFAERGIVATDPGERRVAAYAALLHDVGHGPFSHLFEKILGMHHEAWVAKIILSPETSIHQRLVAEDPHWPQMIVDLLTGDWQGAGFLPGLISSQVDVDRMDYLLRDALMCGVPYGRFDLDRLISCLRVFRPGNGRELVVVHRKGQSAAEAFLLARYFMYWNVYFHKATRSAEVILEKILQRAVHLYRQGRQQQLGSAPPALIPILAGGNITLGEYLRLDEVDCLFAIKQWERAPDGVLSDLCRRLVDRRLLKGIPISGPLDPDTHQAVVHAVARCGYPEPDYYVHEDKAANMAYSYYVRPQGGGKGPVLLLDDDLATRGLALQEEAWEQPGIQPGPGSVLEISKRSDVLRSVSEQSVTRHFLFVPGEARAEVIRLLGRQLVLDL